MESRVSLWLVVVTFLPVEEEEEEDDDMEFVLVVSTNMMVCEC